jgi:hypothetical protein
MLAAIFVSSSFTLPAMVPGGKFEFGIRAFDSSILAECSSAEIRDALDRYLFPPLPRSDPARLLPNIRLRVDHDAKGFHVVLNSEPSTFALTLHDAVLAAVKAIDDAVVKCMTTFRAVHAGAVLIDGKALLFPGSTHAGKSSLVAELLRRGASHFSDEYALIDQEGRVHAYPRPLLQRNGRPLQSLVLPEELNASFASEPAPVGWIVSVEYVQGGAWDIDEVSQGEAVMLLLRNTPHHMDQTPEVIDFFSRVACNAVCYEGKRGDAAEAATRILDLIRPK